MGFGMWVLITGMMQFGAYWEQNAAALAAKDLSEMPGWSQMLTYGISGLMYPALTLIFGIGAFYRGIYVGLRAWGITNRGMVIGAVATVSGGAFLSIIYELIGDEGTVSAVAYGAIAGALIIGIPAAGSLFLLGRRKAAKRVN
jgi:hypothetical protein